MFDVGFSELLLCFIVALVVLGPEKLPRLARTIGQWTGQARGYLRNLTAELDRESQLGDLKRQLEEANDLMRKQQTTARDLLNRVTAEGEQLDSDVRAALGPDAAPTPAPTPAVEEKPVPADDPPTPRTP